MSLYMFYHLFNFVHNVLCAIPNFMHQCGVSLT